VKIGENAILYPNVTILDECTIERILYYGLGQWSESVVTLVQIALYILMQLLSRWIWFPRPERGLVKIPQIEM
jgi:hypothetical protein